MTFRFDFTNQEVGVSLYDKLGVPPDATPDEIKKAYRSLAQSKHPDRQGGSTEAFVEIQKAYDVLGDTERRAHYDATGDDGVDRTAQVAREIAATAVAGVLAEAIRSCSDTQLAQLNIPGMAKEALQKQARSLSRDANAIEKDVRRLTACLARADKDSVTAGVLTSAIEKATAAVAGIRAQVTDVERAIGLLDEAQYHNDKTAAPDDTQRAASEQLGRIQGWRTTWRI